MRTLRFLATITIVCCAFMACNNENGVRTSTDRLAPVAVEGIPIEKAGPMEILRDHITVVDDLVQLNIDRDGAEKLGVTAEEYDFLRTNLEKTNEIVKKHKEENPDMPINWVLDPIK